MNDAMANQAPNDPVIERLKHDVATRLGLMVMEFSRLEMELGLVLHWADEGRHAEEMAERLRRANFNDRLRMLRDQLASEKHAPPAYRAWLAEANQARKLRNRLIHGRWGFHGPDATAPVSNVRGDPWSDEIDEVDTTLAELDEQLAQLKSLRRRLAALRETAPL
jgi:hypothetical protein